jgi:hypothetical protein
LNYESEFNKKLDIISAELEDWLYWICLKDTCCANRTKINPEPTQSLTFIHPPDSAT